MSRPLSRVIGEPPWVAQRRIVIDTLAPAGAPFEYLDADTRGVACPICGEPLRLAFRGELVELDCTAGCAEDDVAQAAFGPLEAM